MTDHYEHAMRRLHRVDELATELQDAYEGPADRALIADIHGDLSRTLKLADIHATLAVADEIHALRQDSSAGRQFAQAKS